jgi:hypothetical protein
MAGVAKYLNSHCSNSVIEATFIRMSKDNRDFHVSPIGKPNAQAELRGLTISRTAAVSSSLWLGGFLQCIFLVRFNISNLCHCPLKFSTATALGTLSQVIASHQRRHLFRQRGRNKLIDRNLLLLREVPNPPMK